MLFSWGRRYQQSLRHNIRLLCTQSQRPTSSSSSFGGSRNGGDERVRRDFEYFLRSITSGVVVVGSTLGYWYCSSLSSPGANNSLHSFSDYATQDQFQQNYENKSKFLFNGNFPFLSLLVEIFIILNLLLYMT
jgi:hypothetical protein